MPRIPATNEKPMTGLARHLQSKKQLPPKIVSPDDLANLRASGITDETIRENELYTADRDTVTSILRNTKVNSAGLIFPYRNLRGEVNGFARVRPHAPRFAIGKSVKYENPINTSPRAYFPKASLRVLLDKEQAVLIVEGEKKALALAQLGYAVIGLGGVDCWGKGGELIPDLREIDWNGREVHIVFDYDEKETTRRNVAGAARRLSNALQQAGAAVRIVQLPPGENGAKQGVDDFLVARGSQGAANFEELLEAAERVAAPVRENTVIKIITTSPPALGEAAYHGLVGDFLRAVAPHTEATDAGVLAHLLPAIGMLAGSGFHYWAGAKQYPRINTVVVGRTNAGRKGTSFAPVDLLFHKVAPEFWSSQRVNGLSSGEGLIGYVADRKERNEEGVHVSVLVEKRLLVVEEEFSRVLAQIRREGNILSQVIRAAYDSGDLATLTVNPRHATGAHISIVGHITPDELAERLDHVDMANGFGNRFLWFSVESVKCMPFTKPIPTDVLSPFVERLRALKNRGEKTKDKAVKFDPAACQRWEEVYPSLREDRAGIAGAMTARGLSFVIRLALIYALADGQSCIELAHLEAALSVWRYCLASAESLFETQTGDKLCDKILTLLRDHGPMTKDDFNKHLSAKQKQNVTQALRTLEGWKQIRSRKQEKSGAGRPATVYELIEVE